MISVVSKKRKNAAGIGKAGALAAVAVALVIAFPTVSAYAAVSGGFADGSDRAVLSFDGTATVLQGPSLRLLTNASYQGGSVEVNGSLASANETVTQTSDQDFQSFSTSDRVAIAGGSLRLDTDEGFVSADASNAFLSGAPNGTALVAGTLQLNGTTAGTWTTENISSPGSTWGNLLVFAGVPAGAAILVDILDANGTTLQAGLESSAVVDLDPVAVPLVRLRLNLTAPTPEATPVVSRITLGHLAGDTLQGSLATRSYSGLLPWSGGYTKDPDRFSYVKDPRNPVVNVKAGTYYAQYVSDASVFLGNGSWHLFAGVWSGSGADSVSIGHAKSTDLVRWTWDPAPVLTASASSWDSFQVEHPWVVENPSGGSPRYLMYYSGWSSATRYASGLATSDDLSNWTKYAANPILTNSTSGWDSWSAGNPRVLYENGTWRMWYAGTDVTTGGGNSMGYATSLDGVNWTKYGSNPVLARNTTSGAIDRNDLQVESVRQWNGTYWAFIGCIPTGGSYHGCVATSTDGINWVLFYRYILNATASAWDGGHIRAGDVIANGGRFIMFFWACNAGCLTQAIGRADVGSFFVTNSTILDAGYSIGVDRFSYGKDPTNPVVNVKAGTYYAQYVSDASVFFDNGSWHLFAGVWSGSGSDSVSIGHAKSTDLVRWAWDGAPVLTATASSWDSFQVEHPWVVNNPSGGSPQYFMYYSGWSSSTRYASGLATSDDLSNWTKYAANPILTNSTAGWDSWSAGNPRVVYENATWKMWYAGSDVTSGGGNSMGYATSLDGVNWTKYGSNPVLARNTTSGAIDRNDLQLESVRQWNGTYWAFFGCIPTGGVYHGCMATSTDGTNWALLNRYVINTSASGWDAGHVRAGDVIVNDGRFTMFYWGCNAGCVTQAIGRADVRYIQGSTTGRIDFHSQIPRALTSLNFQGDLPPGATVQLEIRSSPDASTWTPFETLSYSGAKPSTAADRYVEWRVTMSALPGSAPPIYRGVTIGYDTYFLAGRYTSSAFESPDRLLAATVSITRAPGGGNVSLEVSFDRGTTWAPAANATRVATASANASFVYALAFQGSARLSPVVDEVTLVLQREGYPANVSLRLGLNGTDLPVSAGTVNATVNISLPSSVLNGLVRQARAVDPNATTVDVPVLVRSMHFGSVELLAPRLSFILKNPLTVSFSPVADNLTTDENTSVAFGVTYDVYPPSVPVNISWYLDGREVVGARGQATYDYVANYTSAGLRTVQCLVENGDYFFNRTWNLTVVNVNRPPVFVTISPASPLEVSHAAWTAFEGTAIDPDPEPLSYAWELDGVPLTGGGAYLNVSNWTVGVHTLNLTVRDLEASIQHRWVVTATNAWPVIDSADPATDPAFSHTSSAWFRIVASDADGDVLAFAWRLDGGSVGASLAQILVGNLSVGLHVLSVNVSDGFGRVGHSWTVNSTNAWPTIDSADPATDPAFSHTSSAWFRIVASDADGDVLAFAWQLDYVSVGASIPEILVGNLSVGLHLVSVSVSDGFGQAGRSWSVTSTNIVPAITSVDPTGPWTMSHTASAQFTVGASDPDGDALTFSWQLDGARVAGAGETLWVGNLSVGPHSLTVSVVDRYGVVSHTWDITSTDAAPRIGGVAPPPGPLALNISEFVNFIGRAGDDDGDAVLLAWVVDNATVGNGTTLLIQFGAAGFHVVKLTVPQDLRVPPVVWNVTVAPANQRPVIVSADPGASRVNLQQGAEQEFAVEVEDDGVLPITIVWYLDGTVAGNGGNYTLRTANLSVGSHNVTVQILDGDFRVERDWDIGVVGRPQVVEGPGVEWLLLAAVLAAGVVGFVLLLRLRKRGPTA